MSARQRGQEETCAHGPPSHEAPHPQPGPVQRPAGPGLDLNFREGWEGGHIWPASGPEPHPAGITAHHTDDCANSVF